MNKQIILVLFLISSFLCSAQKEVKFLEYAYKTKSTDSLDVFLQKWALSEGPRNSIDSLNKIQIYTYEIFEDFYNPFNLSKISSGEFGVNLYNGLKNIVIQNSIFIHVYKTKEINFSKLSNTDSLILIKDSIVNFRPKIDLGYVRILYLTPKYSKIINEFLGNKYYPLGTGGIMNPARAKGLSAKKLDFLNSRMKIIYGHWGGYYHIETHPEVFSIDFNKDHTIAKVNYRLVYQGGEATYKKLNGKWIFIDAHLTWIE